MRIGPLLLILFSLTVPASVAKSPPNTSPPGVALVLAGG